MLYEMLTGALPFPNASNAMDMAMARLKEDPVPIQKAGPKVPPRIAEVTMKALERSEANRFANAEAFGVALGEAAAETWGPDWMSESGTAVRGSDAIEQASRTTGAGPRRSGVDQRETRLRDGGVDNRPTSTGDDTRATRVDGDADLDNRKTRADKGDDRETQVRSESSEKDDRATNVVDNRATLLEQAAATAVIPKKRDRELAGANLHELAPEDMLNLAEVRSPRSPLVPAILALIGLAVLAFFVSTGMGEDPAPVASGDDVTVQGIAVNGEELAEVDLTAPFSVTGISGPLNATFLGIPIGSTEAAGGTIDPGYLQYSGAGVIELATEDGDSFPVRSSNNVFLTAPFIVAAMVALGGLGSVQSNLRGMRARRIRVSPYIGLIISGAIMGAGLAVLAMLVLQIPTAQIGVIAAAAAGAFASVALGEAYRRWRRRRRMRRVTVATARR